jgi:hypothetical protein
MGDAKECKKKECRYEESRICHAERNYADRADHPFNLALVGSEIMTKYNLWKVGGAGLAAASSFITIATVACLLSGNFQTAAIVFLAGMTGMIAMIGVLWRTAIQQSR